MGMYVHLGLSDCINICKILEQMLILLNDWCGYMGRSYLIRSAHLINSDMQLENKYSFAHENRIVPPLGFKRDWKKL